MKCFEGSWHEYPMLAKQQAQHSQKVSILYGDRGAVRQCLSMEVVVNLILTNILSVFFIWQAWSTVSKYRAAKTTLQV